MNEQLIVIGNGFDLTAKLNSSYNSFFNYYFSERLEKDEEFRVRREEAFKNNNENDIIGVLSQEKNNSLLGNINYWFEIFWEYRPKLKGAVWSDIESVILKELKAIDENYDDYYQNRYSMDNDEPRQDVICQKLSTLEKPITNAQLYESAHHSFGGSDGRGGIAYTDMKNIPQSPIENAEQYVEQTSKEKFILALYDDLMEVEIKFAEFLEKEIHGSDNYVDNASQLMDELIVREFIASPSDDCTGNAYVESKKEFIDKKLVKTQILSFNYTRETNDNEFTKVDLFNNVHGELKQKNMVFGIDSHLVGDTPILSLFTKTYRIMEFLNNGFNFSSNLKFIKFYGHGLADADYSYFQTIFDSINLYSGKTILVFYYNIYDEAKAAKIKVIFKQSVYRLIRKYGETLDNKDHGKNMLHKLLMEGRIKTKEMNVEFVSSEK